MKKLVVTICLIVVMATIAGIICFSTQSNANKSTPDESLSVEYSVGLDENGYYVNLDKYNFDVPNFKDMEISIDNIIDFSIKKLKESKYEIESETDFIDSYIVSYLESIDVNKKDVAEETDIVTVSLEFRDLEGNVMSDYTQDKMSIQIDNEGDSIVKSLIGRKVGDEYEVDYTFPEDDENIPGKKAKVKVKVLVIAYADPIASGVFDKNIDRVKEDYPEVIDLDSFRKILRPDIARDNLTAYLENLILNANIDVPDEFINYEYQRLLKRLNQIGYNYQEYLEQSNLTDAEVKETCKEVAAENIISMLVFKDGGYEITDEKFKEVYGSEEDINTYESYQGIPYMKLRIIRATAMDIISSQVKLVDGNKVISLNSSQKATPDEVVKN